MHADNRPAGGRAATRANRPAITFTFDSRAQRQHGVIAVAVLVTLVILGAASAYRQQRATPAARVAETRFALERARDALLGYAAAYPDRVNSEFGPGYLPCPARDARGIAAPACSARTGSTLGRFPWHTLRTREVRDAAGEPLWYAVRQTHRYNPKLEPLNGDSDAGNRSWVAILIAPGAALPGQRRGASAAAGNYLEASPFAATTLHPTPRDLALAGNDQWLAIDGATWADAVEPRVLGAVATALRRYTAHHGRLPWLRAAGSERGSAPQGELEFGQLPIHEVSPGARRADAPEFATRLAVDWDFSRATVATTGAASLIGDCIYRQPCRLPSLASASATLPDIAGSATCRWWTPDPERAPRDVASCTMHHRYRSAAHELIYDLNFTLPNAGEASAVLPPGAHAPRRRDVSARLPQATAGTGWELAITLTLMNSTGARLARAALRFDANTVGRFNARGIRYALDANAGEIPVWLTRNDWDLQLRVARSGDACTRSDGCVVLDALDRNGALRGRRRVRALLVLSGPALPLNAPRMTGAAEDAWFELGNIRAGDPQAPFVRAPLGGRFNDRLRVLALSAP